MGGHGGLNILPQKRWNVYNRDNRLKVERDEAKAKKQEDEARERYEQAEREARHARLLRRSGVAAGQGGLGGEEVPGEAAAAAPLEHINFWKEEEIKLQHPDNEKQQREELKRRGNPDTYTSDAKFDERFALAYGVGGDKPWYAQAQRPEPQERPAASTAPALTAGGAFGLQALPHAKAGRSLLPEQLQPPQPPKPKRRHISESDSDSSSRSTSSLTSTSSDDGKSTSSSEPSDNSASSTSSDSSGSGSDGRRRRRKRRRSRSRSSSRSPSRRRSRSTKRHGRRKRRRHGSSKQSDSDSDAKRSSRRARAKSKSKSRRKLKAKRHRSASERQAPIPAAGSKSIEQLRAERLQREKEERLKQRGLLASVAVLPDGPPDKEYNSAFGFAAAIKRRRTQ